MVQATICFPFALNQKLSLVFIAYAIWNSEGCCGNSVLESFETCGIFLQDAEPNSIKRGDIIHQIIKNLQLKHRKPQCLLIKNELAKREIHPDIFRSMKYDCFFHVHINFGKELFPTIPPFKTPLLSALYQKASLLVFTETYPHNMFNGETWYLQHERQYRIFIIRIKMTPHYEKQRAKPFAFYKAYFFCTFCKGGLVQLSSPITTPDMFSQTIESFEKEWVPEFAEHYMSSVKNQRAYDEECIKKDVMKMYNQREKCQPNTIIARMIIFASGCNFTLKLIRHNASLKIPRIAVYSRKTKFESYTYSSPILRHYDYPSIIYCFNLKRVTIAQTNMWTKYISMYTWALLGLCLLVLSFLNTVQGSVFRNKSFKSLMLNLLLFVNSFVKLMGILSRQSWNHKWKLFGLVEIMFSILIAVYENSITAEVVVPLVPQPFKSTLELFNNNYTFVAQFFPDDRIYNRMYSWLSDEYDTKNHPRVLKVHNFANIARWLKKLFLQPVEGKKYAIVGYLSKNYHFRAVKFVREKYHTCYQMYPKERAFIAQPIFFVFKSAVPSSLQKGALFLQAFGFTRAFEASGDFLGYSVALGYARKLANQYGYKGITCKDLKNNRLKESMVILENLRLILYLATTLTLAACVCLVIELITRKKFP